MTDTTRPIPLAFYRRALDRIRARFALLVLAFSPLVGCGATPAKVPTAIEAATVAVNLTDEALAAAIDADVNYTPARTTVWAGRVVLLSTAARAVRAGEDVCETLPTVGTLATEIKCKPCETAVTTALRALGCK